MPTTEHDAPVESWAEQFENAGLMERARLLGGGAIRLTANALDFVLKRVARTAVDAEKAFLDELDPNVSDAKVIEEVEEG